MKKFVWLSYDLGVNGDYDGMYAWLDNHEAKDCGDSFAFLAYDAKGDVIKEMTDELKKLIKLNAQSRVYLVSYDTVKKSYRGRFIIGGRKQAPWTGYGSGSKEETSDEP